VVFCSLNTLNPRGELECSWYTKDEPVGQSALPLFSYQSVLPTYNHLSPYTF
jgi:hypothetical protein